jgi:hypothetical protein
VQEAGSSCQSELIMPLPPATNHLSISGFIPAEP